MLARKALLARLAVSAASLATCISRWARSRPSISRLSRRLASSSWLVRFSTRISSSACAACSITSAALRSVMSEKEAIAAYGALSPNRTSGCEFIEIQTRSPSPRVIRSTTFCRGSPERRVAKKGSASPVIGRSPSSTAEAKVWVDDRPNISGDERARIRSQLALTAMTCPSAPTRMRPSSSAAMTDR